MEVVPLLCLLTMWSIDVSCPGSYHQDRESFIRKEQSRFLGSSIVLNKEEQFLNNALMTAKRLEFDQGFKDVLTFQPARHFFQAKHDIGKSKVFKIIQKLPKGAVLHVHDKSMGSQDLLFNQTFLPHLYVCTDKKGVYVFHFFERPDQACKWKLLSKLRAEAKNVTELNESIKRQFTLEVPNPKEKYAHINAVWSAFSNIFISVSGLLSYRPVFEAYYYNVLEEYRNDNIMYIEIRTTFPDVYELNGSLHTGAAVAKIYDKVTKKFMKHHRDFFGVRLIYSPQRQPRDGTALNFTQTLLDLKAAFPNFVCGFDFVGQEDVGKPLLEYAKDLLKLPIHVKFFFHAGETNWEGYTDLNLVDAVLLNTTRIGHGYALLKHPLVLQLVKERGIGIEVSPISNQVLMLVEDLRNHPAAVLLADGYPVVICSDDPGFWGASPLSHDWYEAFMGLAGLESDLRTLKQLAINSIKYSALDDKQKNLAMLNWQKKWTKFVTEKNF